MHQVGSLLALNCPSKAYLGALWVEQFRAIRKTIDMPRVGKAGTKHPFEYSDEGLPGQERTYWVYCDETSAGCLT